MEKPRTYQTGPRYLPCGMAILAIIRHGQEKV